MSGTALSGIAAVLAAVGLSATSKDSVSRDALDSAITAALAEGEKAGIEKAANDAAKITADAMTAAKERAKAILGSADAKGREDLAQHLAFESDMTAEAAVGVLSKSPKAAPPSRLGEVPNPDVDLDAPPATAGEGLNAAVDRMVAKIAKK